MECLLLQIREMVVWGVFAAADKGDGSLGSVCCCCKKGDGSLGSVCCCR